MYVWPVSAGTAWGLVELRIENEINILQFFPLKFFFYLETLYYLGNLNFKPN